MAGCSPVVLTPSPCLLEPSNRDDDLEVTVFGTASVIGDCSRQNGTALLNGAGFDGGPTIRS